MIRTGTRISRMVPVLFLGGVLVTPDGCMDCMVWRVFIGYSRILAYITDGTALGQVRLTRVSSTMANNSVTSDGGYINTGIFGAPLIPPQVPPQIRPQIRPQVRPQVRRLRFLPSCLRRSVDRADPDGMPSAGGGASFRPQYRDRCAEVAVAGPISHILHGARPL